MTLTLLKFGRAKSKQQPLQLQVTALAFTNVLSLYIIEGHFYLNKIQETIFMRVVCSFIWERQT